MGHCYLKKLPASQKCMGQTYPTLSQKGGIGDVLCTMNGNTTIIFKANYTLSGKNVMIGAVEGIQSHEHAEWNTCSPRFNLIHSSRSKLTLRHFKVFPYVYIGNMHVATL